MNKFNSVAKPLVANVLYLKIKSDSRWKSAESSKIKETKTRYKVLISFLLEGFLIFALFEAESL